MSEENAKDKIDELKHKYVLRGPGDDCSCPVCIFAKSQAPGEPYDLSQCPKYIREQGKDNKE